MLYIVISIIIYVIIIDEFRWAAIVLIQIGFQMPLYGNELVFSIVGNKGFYTTALVFCKMIEKIYIDIKLK